MYDAIQKYLYTLNIHIQAFIIDAIKSNNVFEIRFKISWLCHSQYINDEHVKHFFILELNVFLMHHMPFDYYIKRVFENSL